MNIFLKKKHILNFKECLNQTEEEELTKAIKFYFKQKRLSIILMIIGYLFSIIAVGIPILIYGIYLYFSAKKSITINYELSSEQLNGFDQAMEPVSKMNNCCVRWHVLNTTNIDKSRAHAGATSSLNMVKLKKESKSDRFIKSNVNYYTMKLTNGLLIFLPNIVIYVKKGKFNLIKYEKIKFEPSFIKFREYGTIPKDAEILDYTWKYVNNNGTPDKRYKDNVKVPICKYCEIDIVLNTNVETIMVSNFS